VFKITPQGVKSVVHNFESGSDGAVSYASLIADADGNLYGTTTVGGINNNGTVFKITPQGQETVLYSFESGADGAYPYGGLTLNTDGNLYGTTKNGGINDYGTVFKITPQGVETVLYSFQDGSDGAFPVASLVADANGNLYGTTSGGGSDYAGTVFKITSQGVESVLHSFQGGADGAVPQAGLILDATGNLYGTTQDGGGINDYGTVFKITPQNVETVLYSFRGVNDGANPYAGLILDATGNLYGTTAHGGFNNYGTVFKITPQGQETVLYRFQSGSNGAVPQAGLIFDATGNLYGTTQLGGDNSYFGHGTVFKLKLK
jgi:uncharacterized repeat protein (TIGR03803 family)